MTMAGTPPTIAEGGTSLVTTDPAAITAPSPTLTPAVTLTLWPVHTSLPMVTCLNMSGVRSSRTKSLYSSTQSNDLGGYWNSLVLSQLVGWLNGWIAVRPPIAPK